MKFNATFVVVTTWNAINRVATTEIYDIIDTPRSREG
jgi:hypothetical protein